MSTPPDPYNIPGDDKPNDLPSFQPSADANQAKPVARPQPPSSILNAVKLMFVGAGLSALGIIVSFTTTDQIREQLADADDSLTGDELDAGVNLTIGIGVFIGLIGIGLWIWMALANKRGKGWARIVATVLGGLYAVSTVFSLSVAIGLTTILSLITLAMAAVIIWLLFRPESSQYYNAVAEFRHQHGR